MFTTVADPADTRPADLVNRQCTAAAPNRLRVTDIIYVPTWQGFCYTAFVTDVCARTIIGWAVSTAIAGRGSHAIGINRAVWQYDSDITALIDHSDRGSQDLSLTDTDRLIELGIAPSVGLRGDGYDDALSGAVNAVYKTEPNQRAPYHGAASMMSNGRPPMGGLVQPGTSARSTWPRSTSRVRGRVDDDLKHCEPPIPTYFASWRQQTPGSTRSVIG